MFFPPAFTFEVVFFQFSLLPDRKRLLSPILFFASNRAQFSGDCVAWTYFDPLISASQGEACIFRELLERLGCF
jgi:hypothetical protein